MALKSTVIIAILFFTHAASATFIGDTIDAKYENAFGTVFNSSAVVGAGVEFSGSNLIHDYTLDFTDDAFTLTVSKDYSAGNFTGIFTKLTIGDIAENILGVTFDSANSSAFSNGNVPSINFSSPGSLILSWGGTFLSANTPASALSHSFTWNVDFGDSIAVAEPSSFLLFGLGILGLAAIRRRQAS